MVIKIIFPPMKFFIAPQEKGSLFEEYSKKCISIEIRNNEINK